MKQERPVITEMIFSVLIVISLFTTKWSWCSRGEMVKAMKCGIVVSEFELLSRYYIHFRTNTLGKGMSPFILTAMG